MESGDFVSDGYRVIYSGGMKKERRVGIVLDSDTAKRVIRIEQLSDRVLVVKMQAEPADIVLVQAYMPTSSHEDEEIERIYDQLDEIIGKQKGTDYLVVIGDMNAVVGERDEMIVGSSHLFR